MKNSEKLIIIREELYSRIKEAEKDKTVLTYEVGLCGCARAVQQRLMFAYNMCPENAPKAYLNFKYWFYKYIKKVNYRKTKFYTFQGGITGRNDQFHWKVGETAPRFDWLYRRIRVEQNKEKKK